MEIRTNALLTLVLGALSAILSTPAPAQTPQHYKVGWSTYVGWMPWHYAVQSAILAKWADRYGIEIELVKDEYARSIERYTAGDFAACAMTNVDLLTLPAAKGVDSTVVILGDFSNGNDGIVLKGSGATIADLKNRSIHLVEGSVSHYLVIRALQSAGIPEYQIKLVNTDDADIVQAMQQPSVTAAVTWKPHLAQVLKIPNTALVFDSGDIPGEIMDLMVVRTDVLKNNPKLAQALVGAWYETLKLMSPPGPGASAALDSMAKASGSDLAGFKDQLRTTRLITQPAEAYGLMTGMKLTATMGLVRDFSFSHRLLGPKIKSAQAIGIQFPGDRISGDPGNIRIRFDPSYTRAVIPKGKGSAD